MLASHILCVMSLVFFFFKQKTAYEMRISDWSSDVCSSDLRDILAHLVSGAVAGDGEHQWPVVAAGTKRQVERTQVDRLVAPGLGEGGARRDVERRQTAVAPGRPAGDADDAVRIGDDEIGRAAWRERACQSVYISAVAGSYNKKQ